MPAPGYTPVIIYHSNTAAAVPSTGNLTNGEIAINITEKKIYTKSFAGSLVTLVDTMGSQSAASVAITGGAINGTVIGGSSPAAGTFTTVNGTVLTMTGDSAFTSTGALKIPVGTTGQQPTGADGKIRYNSSITKYEGYSNGAWSSLGGGATGGGADEIFIQNGQTVTVNYTIPTGKNAMSTGPITINSGVVVTVPAGSRWVIL